MKSVILLAIALALASVGASASASESASQVIKRQAPQGITASFYACIDKAGSDTVAVGSCLTTEKKTQDARLNTSYKALLAKLTGKAKDRLVASERAWLEFHNKAGDFESALYGDDAVADL
jgi:uncharacterized protein YecT (DUF1311 family)